VSPAAAAPSRPLTREAVAGARIAGVFDQPVGLVGGVYEGAPLVAGGAARPRLRLLADLVTIADVDPAPGSEAVALLAESSGGSGERIYLSLVGARDGQVSSLATILVGDRTKIRGLTVADSKVVLDVVETGPSDPACCPTQVARKTYAFANGVFAVEQSNVTGTLSTALLAGVEWTVIEIDGEPLPADTRKPTVQIEGTRIAGFSGCNRYTGSFTEPAPGALKMGPAAGTRMACPDPAGQVEQRFLRTLAAVTQYAFVAGRVAFTGLDNGTMRSLLLTRTS
jgi:heat shock protein HslJ